MSRVRAGWLPLLLLLLALLAGCGDGTPPVPPVVRLWRDRAPVLAERPVPGTHAGTPVLEVRFDGTLTIYRAVSTEEAALQYEPVRPDGGSVVLEPDQGVYALALPVTVRPGEALELTVRVSAPGADGAGSERLVAAAVELREPFDTATRFDLEDAVRLFDTERHGVVALRGTVGADPVTLRAGFVTDALTRGLLIHLVAPGRADETPLRVSAVTLRRLPLAEHVAAGGAVPGVTPLEAGPCDAAVRATLDRDERQGLLALPPSRFVFELAPWPASRRLALSLGVMPRDASFAGAVRFVVRVRAGGSGADVSLLDEVLEAPADASVPAWNDRRLELPASPDGPLRVELSTEGQGPDPPLAVLGHPTVTTGERAHRPNVVLVSLDTLRPDRLGCYGGDPSLTPRLDELAAESLRFEQAYSTSTYTLPSHASLMTGQYPALHGTVDVTDTIDTEHSPLLADLLARAGWVTAAFTGGGYVATHFGFAHGFDRYSENDPVWAWDTLRGRQLIDTVSWARVPVQAELLRRYDADSVAEWIEAQRGGAPFFLFVHTYIAHNYAPDRRALEEHGLLLPGGLERPFNHKDRERYNDGELALRQKVYGQYMPYYEATVEMADRFVGRLVDALAEAGLDEDTLLIVTADHGEEFGEHAFFGHGETVYDVSARIPLIVRPPGPAAARRGRVLHEPISLVDVAPWVLRQVGLEPDPRMAVGPPLGPERADPPGRTSLFVELDNRLFRTSAVRDGSLKLVERLGRDGEDLARPERELYDLATDPGEQHDLLPVRAADADRLERELERFHELAEAVRPRHGGPADLSELPEETRHQLQALGYLGTGPAPADGTGDGR